MKVTDGSDHVDTVGIDRSHVREWKDTLDSALSDLEYWGRIWERRNRRTARVAGARNDEWHHEYVDDPDEAVAEWDADETADIDGAEARA